MISSKGPGTHADINTDKLNIIKIVIVLCTLVCCVISFIEHVVVHSRIVCVIMLFYMKSDLYEQLNM